MLHATGSREPNLTQLDPLPTACKMVKALAQLVLNVNQGGPKAGPDHLKIWAHRTVRAKECSQTTVELT